MELRVARPDDGKGLQNIYEPIVTDTAISFEYVPPTADEMSERVQTTIPHFPWLVADDAGIAGYAYAGPYAARTAYRWSASVSVYLREDARGRGLGRQLYSALFSLLEVQGYRQLVAGITLPNEASVRLHESLGFRPVGTYRNVGWKLGAWHDVGHWQRTIDDDESPPEQPTAFADLAPDLLASALHRFS